MRAKVWVYGLPPAERQVDCFGRPTRARKVRRLYFLPALKLNGAL